MAFDSSGGVACDRLAEADQCERGDRKPGLLAHFANDCLFQALPEFDAAARQRIKPVRRRAAAAHDQNPIVVEDRRADRQIRSRWISPDVVAVAHFTRTISVLYQDGSQRFITSG